MNNIPLDDESRAMLHANRKWYLLLGVVFILFATGLFTFLPFATFAVIFWFGLAMMVGGVIHIIAGVKLFDGVFRIFWLLFAILYFIAGYYALTSPAQTAVALTNLLAIFLIIAGITRMVGVFFAKNMHARGWTFLSGVITTVAGLMVLFTPTAPFWVLGLFFAMDLLFQGFNYLALSSYIKREVPKPT
ncbi:MULTISPECIES: HdeD family acid-resistance protein [Vitreoscilla]|uniref:HdeD family acid-resistance protein n=1 Tax=Vitreoscilla stercoraria TaxID=61 RepID=A0ABY4ECK6_VITST|nr:MULTISPECIES: HdeD family acid-resistance protein [Vitreoscilla]AUZ04125.1 hypothetical protein ADP71_03120 [Vitreoscilla sp. C1]UOO93182.1 HdeD family acid-resistance protein [Vitreoscilla stercoraria]